jgi:hypothetical protein
MNTLPQTALRRLKKIPQIPSVWEGDRRTLAGLRGNGESDGPESGECIIWVDGSEGFVRAMDVVTPEMGPEAVVRTLLRAIETPHSPAKPARPQKIVVSNRELQFFLRGALQSLDIAIDYVSELPLIDELFRGFEAMGNSRPPALPSQYEVALKETAFDIWKIAPWELLADHDILAIELNHWELGTIYACVMGMLGREYGLILYRSLESLKQFRQAALTEQAVEDLEKAFLSQDCWFVNFESTSDIDEEDEEDFDLSDLPLEEIIPRFGSIHPYEGIRPYLDEEEVNAVYVVLQAILRFVRACQRELAEDPIGAVNKRYSIPPLDGEKSEKPLSVKVSTLPALAGELLDMFELSEYEDEDEDEDEIPLRGDLVPADAFLSLGMMPWDMVEKLQNRSKLHYQSQGAVARGEGMPIILIQTSRPKAKEMIETIQASGGLKGIGFNPGEDPFSETTYDLGILQMENGQLYLFGEFINDDADHVKARQKWDRRCQETQGYCALVVAMGVTGSSRGKPQLQDMLAFFEAKSIDIKDLDLGVLQLMPQFEL